MEATFNAAHNASTDETGGPLASSSIVEALTAELAEQYADDLKRLQHYLVDFYQRLEQDDDDVDASSWTNLIDEFETGVQVWLESQQTTVEQMDETTAQFGDLGPQSAPIEETSLELTALLGALTFSLTSAALDPDRQMNRDLLGVQHRELIATIDEYLKVEGPGLRDES